MIKALALIGGFQAASIAVTVIRSKLISVTLGPAGLGVIGAIDQFLSVVVQFSALSLPAVAIRLMPRSYGVDPDGFRRQYANFVKAVLVTTIAGTAVVSAVVWVAPQLLGEELAVYRRAVALALTSVPLMALGLLLPNVLAAAQRPAGAAVLYFAVAAASTIAAWIGLVVGGILEIYVAQALALLLCLGGMLLYLHRRFDLPLRSRGNVLKQLIQDNPDLISTSAVAYTAFVGAALTLFAVRAITLTAEGAEVAGLLQALLSAVLAVGAVLSAMSGRYLGPLLNRRTEPVDKGAVSELFRRRQLIFLTMIAVPLTMFGHIALALLFSPRFIAADAWLPAFLIWQLVTLQLGIQQQLLFALDDLKPVAVIAVVGNAFSIALCAAAVPRFGLTGAAAAMVAGALLMNAMGAYRLRHTHQIAPRPGSKLLTAYVVVALLVGPYLMQQLGTPAETVLPRVGTCILLVASLWIFADASEKAQLKALATKLRRAV